MLKLSLDPQRAACVVCLGAHADDIEIGCGGTILRLCELHHQLSVFWVVFSANELRAQEARATAARFLQGACRSEVVLFDFRDGFFPYQGAEIKERFERIKSAVTPDLVFTHYRNDRHQDHRLLSDLTWNTFRSHAILEYEIPKYDGDLGAPNVFVPLSEELARRKARYLLEGFASQREKRWFTADTFLSLMRMRGIEAAEETHYAEAFHGRKLLLAEQSSQLVPASA